MSKRYLRLRMTIGIVWEFFIEIEFGKNGTCESQFTRELAVVDLYNKQSNTNQKLHTNKKKDKTNEFIKEQHSGKSLRAPFTKSLYKLIC